MERPNLDDLLREQDEFIGPKQPPKGPKMAGSGPYWTPTDQEIKEQFPNLFRK